MDNSGKVALQKCSIVKLSIQLSYEMVSCEITQNDLDYIEKNDQTNIFNKILCGYMLNSYLNIIKLDPKNYLTFSITQFLKLKDTILTYESELILVSKITGGAKDHKINENFFAVLLEIEYKNQNETFMTECGTNNNAGTQTNLKCYLDIEKNETVSYKNIYLLPYHFISEYKTPFDLIINGAKKAGGDPEPKPTLSSYLEYPIVLLLSILLLLF